jgi:hypothetical protein
VPDKLLAKRLPYSTGATFSTAMVTVFVYKAPAASVTLTATTCSVCVS